MSESQNGAFHYCDNIHGKKQCVDYIQLALDQKPGGIKGITVELSTDNVHKQHRTRTLTLSLRDACRIRHLRWFWRQRTSQSRKLCSSTTTCKWGLSHQVFLPAAKLHIFHSCILYVKTVTGLHQIQVFIKKCVQQNTDCLVSQTLSGLNKSPVFTSKQCKRGMKHNIICTCKYNIYKNDTKLDFFVPCEFKDFFGMSKNLMTFLTMCIKFQEIKPQDQLQAYCSLDLKWIQFPICRVA